MAKKQILIALVPVIHVKYMELFKKYPDHLYILDDSILEKWNRFENLKRDLRTIGQKKIYNLLRKSGLLKKIDLLKTDNLKDIQLLQENDSSIIMPDEDVSRWFAEKFLPNKKIVFENVFLRWDSSTSVQKKKESEIDNDRIISKEKAHRELIKKAASLKEKSANWWRQIGVLATGKKGDIILTAFNRHVPTQENIAVYGDLRTYFDFGQHHELSNSIHAEASLIGTAAKRGIPLEGCSLYVTTFPCPTCAKLIVEAGIEKVYYSEGYSLSDAEDILKNAEVELILVREQEKKPRPKSEKPPLVAL